MERRRADDEYLYLLVRAGELLGESLDLATTLENVCAAAVTTVADVCLIDLGPAGETFLAAAAHRNPALTQAIRDAGIHLESTPGRPIHPVCQVISSGEPFFAPSIDGAWIAANSTRDEHERFLKEMQFASMIVVPVTSQVYGVTGALTLATTEDGRTPFTQAALDFALDLGRRCGAAIGKARLYEQVTHALRRFQTAALPRSLPAPPGVVFSAHYEPASAAMMIGGDWYDAFPLPDGRIGISIGDVSGHGLEASVVMASMRNAVRTALVATNDIVEALVSSDFVLRTEGHAEHHFCTALLAIFDPQTYELTCSSCGHPGPKIWDARKRAVMDPFTDRHAPLGLGDLTLERPRATTFGLASGSAIAFFTDGLIEKDGDIIAGEAALEAALARPEVRDAENFAAAIRDAIAPGALKDDLAILTCRLL